MSGCELYPVKDIIKQMCSNRSLNTLEDVWTGLESTIFPYSTTNERDFYNLMSIYLESIFNPLNKKVDFLIEGIRKEFDEGKLQLKGNGFEEIKYNMQKHDEIFLENIQTNIYKGSYFSHTSKDIY